MSAERARAFVQTRACPSSEDVSLSQSRRLPPTKAQKLARHIASQIAGCEFCAAEQSFLSAFVQNSEEYKPAEMPTHLRRLAEALLIGKLKNPLKGSKYEKGSSLTRTGIRI